MSIKIYLLFFCATLLILSSYIFSSTVMNGNDLNGNIVPLLHFQQSVRNDIHFPQWNPYINQGIPAVADPLYGVYNPIIGLTILLFDYQTAIKLMYFISIYLGCVCMFLLVRLFKISNTVSLLIAITYASGTYLTSRIVSGHLEKVVSFAFLPLFIYCLIRLVREKNVLWSGITAITLSLILFTGDIYNAIYCVYSVAACGLYFLLKDRKSSFYLFLSICLFFFFSAIKIIPMIELQAYISKIKEPFAGGLNISNFVSNLFLPIPLNTPFVNYLSTGFGWWESLSFIGPVSILGLYFILKSITKKRNQELTVIIVLMFLYTILSTPGLKVNPYHYLISSIDVLQFFHVPSRILALWGILILVCLAIYTDKWKKRHLTIVLLSVNLIGVYSYSQYVLINKDFITHHDKYIAPLEWIKKNNPNNLLTVHAKSQGNLPQDKAYLHKLLILQSNYGLFIKNSLGEKYNFRNENTYQSYNDIKPGFIISDEKLSENYLEKIKEFPNVFIYKDKKAVAFAQIKNNPQKVLFMKDKIILAVNSKDQEKLTLLESNYPGWAAFVNGRPVKILPGRFLTVNTLPGNNHYEFKYSSHLFGYGLIISATSFFIWGGIVLKKNFKD